MDRKAACMELESNLFLGTMRACADYVSGRRKYLHVVEKIKEGRV